MTEKTWRYATPTVSEVPAPYIKIAVYNLERSSRYPSKGTLNAMVDTGFDGYLIIPTNVFHELKLDSFEIPPDLIETTETFSGERLRLRTALGIVEIPGILEKQVEVDAHERCHEPLVGRRLLENLVTILDGPKRKITISTK